MNASGNRLLFKLLCGKDQSLVLDLEIDEYMQSNCAYVSLRDARGLAIFGDCASATSGVFALHPWSRGPTTFVTILIIRTLRPTNPIRNSRYATMSRLCSNRRSALLAFLWRRLVFPIISLRHSAQGDAIVSRLSSFLTAVHPINVGAGFINIIDSKLS